MNQHGTSLLESLIAARRPNCSLDRSFYVSGEVFQHEMEQIWRSKWLFVGHACEIPKPGDFFTFELDGDSLILIRGEGGGIHALFNTCRHRGSRICLESKGHAHKLVCPYHQWVYDQDGALRNASDMGTGFSKDNFALRKAATCVIGGLVFVCLHPHPPDFEMVRKLIDPQVRDQGLDRAKICHELEVEVRANWKILYENHSECYHCLGSHPEYCKVYQLGSKPPIRDATEDRIRNEQLSKQRLEHWRSQGLHVNPVDYPDGNEYACHRIALPEGVETESVDGKSVAPLMGDYKDWKVGSLRFLTWPNFWSQGGPDYFMTARLLPVSASMTRLRLCWLVNQDAVEGQDYDVERVVHLWKSTAQQDWKLCENSQLGIMSSQYEPGPYSLARESGVERFVQWYLNQMLQK